MSPSLTDRVAEMFDALITALDGALTGAPGARWFLTPVLTHACVCCRAA
jgi:hypothetical protein